MKCERLRRKPEMASLTREAEAAVTTRKRMRGSKPFQQMMLAPTSEILDVLMPPPGLTSEPPFLPTQSSAPAETGESVAVEESIPGEEGESDDSFWTPEEVEEEEKEEGEAVWVPRKPPQDERKAGLWRATDREVSQYLQLVVDQYLEKVGRASEALRTNMVAEMEEKVMDGTASLRRELQEAMAEDLRIVTDFSDNFLAEAKEEYYIKQIEKYENERNYEIYNLCRRYENSFLTQRNELEKSEKKFFDFNLTAIRSSMVEEFDEKFRMMKREWLKKMKRKRKSEEEEQRREVLKTQLEHFVVFCELRRKEEEAFLEGARSAMERWKSAGPGDAMQDVERIRHILEEERHRQLEEAAWRCTVLELTAQLQALARLTGAAQQFSLEELIHSVTKEEDVKEVRETVVKTWDSSPEGSELLCGKTTVRRTPSQRRLHVDLLAYARSLLLELADRAAGLTAEEVVFLRTGEKKAAKRQRQSIQTIEDLVSTREQDMPSTGAPSAEEETTSKAGTVDSVCVVARSVTTHASDYSDQESLLSRLTVEYLPH